MAAINIVNVGYDSTNYYVLADERPRLLIDVGFPGTLPKLQHECRRMDIQLSDIPYLLVTHYHPDHAALAQELKHIGMKLVVMDVQLAAIPILKTLLKPSDGYVDIRLDDNRVVNLPDSRAFLKTVGIGGEILHTPGHSDDSVSLVLDQGSVFTGDLPHPMLAGDNPTVGESWAKIRAAGGKLVYPGHGPAMPLT